MISIIISKIIGMLRDVILANYFGASSISGGKPSLLDKSATID